MCGLWKDRNGNQDQSAHKWWRILFLIWKPGKPDMHGLHGGWVVCLGRVWTLGDDGAFCWIWMTFHSWRKGGKRGRCFWRLAEEAKTKMKRRRGRRMDWRRSVRSMGGQSDLGWWEGRTNSGECEILWGRAQREGLFFC